MSARPLYQTEPDPKAGNRVKHLEGVAEAIGMPLLPWARDFLAVATEHDDDGIPRRRRALATVPRQSGKSIMVATVAIEAMLRQPGSYGVYIAQTRQAATNRLRGIGELLFRSGLDLQANLTLGAGNERLRLGNGSELQVMPPSASSVHGESLDVAILDEVFAIDPIVMTGLTPAMAARPHAQLWMVSTAGTLADSHLLNSLTELGRDDPDGPMAFVEYGLPPDVHPLDFEAYPTFHPGLGHTTSLEFIRDEATHLPLPQFTRSYGNRPTAQDEIVIPAEWYERSINPLPVRDGLTLAVDRSRWGASVAAAWYKGDDLYHADVVDYREGDDLDWLPGRIRELVGKFSPLALACDVSGPVKSLEPELRAVAEDHALTWLPWNTTYRAKADAFLLDMLKDNRLTHNDLQPLKDAVENIGVKVYGESFRFDRTKAIVDPSPLIALSLALYGAYEMEVLHPRPLIAF